MSDERAAGVIAHVAPRKVDVTRWLFVGSIDRRYLIQAKDSARRQFGSEIVFHIDLAPELCGAIFEAENDSAISAYASTLLQYFFKRDGAEARVFEFDKFTHHFFARRLDEVIARTV